MSKSKLPEKVRVSSARAYDLLFNSGPKSKNKPSGASAAGSGASLEQVTQKVEILREREESFQHRSLPEQTSDEEPTNPPVNDQSSPNEGASAVGNDEHESVCDSAEIPRRKSKDIAQKLISKDDIMCYFSELIEDCAADVIDEKLKEEDADMLTSLELGKAMERSEHRFAHVCDLPLKIVLTPLSRGGRIVSRFANLLEMQFGPLHASLRVGNVILEWNDSSLVIPHLCKHGDELLQSDVQGLSEWAIYTSKQYDDVRSAMTTSDYQKQIEIVFRVTAEKRRHIEALVDVIIKYNTFFHYNLFDRNCQHFVLDALKALGVEKPPEFTGGLRDYFKALKEGRSPSVLAKFATHAALDSYVKEKESNGEINKMEQNDLEFLLAQCFRFHLKQKSELQDENADLSNWACKEPTCCMQRLERRIRFETLRIHNFKAISIA